MHNFFTGGRWDRGFESLGHYLLCEGKSYFYIHEGLDKPKS